MESGLIGEHMKRRIEVRVKPNAKAEGLEEQADGTWIARIKAPPVDGRAKAAISRPSDSQVSARFPGVISARASRPSPPSWR